MECAQTLTSAGTAAKCFVPRVKLMGIAPAPQPDMIAEEQAVLIRAIAYLTALVVIRLDKKCQ
jgi:hypothetical protein